ncbi:FAD-dependent oxidoreductase [Achromobacter kerstersii]
MNRVDDAMDAVVIGGGFYGSALGVYLARQRKLKRVLLVEQEPALLTRASYTNQARVHNGYHYPRSFTTAYRSRVNLPRFVRDWPFAVKKDFIKLYAIAKRNSKVTAKQFRRFCREIGAQIEPAHPSQRSLFETRLIEEVFAVEEYAFDATKLARWADLELAESGVQVRLSTRAVSIFRADQQRLSILLRDEDGIENTVHSRLVFNCTYSGLNQIGGDFPCTRTGIKQEITEMALMRPPLELEGLGITVMDGPFFSFMPFPAQGLHTLSHVRYTPHCSWADAPDINPYQKLANYNSRTRVDRMLRDVSRYLPSIRGASYVESLFEIKTILAKNEGDDGRPILFEKCIELPGCYSLLGGKIDNIYDVLEKLDAENLTTALEK